MQRHERFGVEFPTCFQGGSAVGFAQKRMRKHRRQRRGMERMYSLQHFNRGMLCVIYPPIFCRLCCRSTKTVNRMGFKQYLYCHSHYIISHFVYTLRRIYRVNFLCHTQLHNVTVRYKISVQYMPLMVFFAFRLCKIQFRPRFCPNHTGELTTLPKLSQTP